MFQAPSREEALNIIQNAEPSIQAVSNAIHDGCNLPEERIRIMEKILSGPVNQGFNAATNSAKKFHVDNSCIGCGLCVKHCPTNNVRLADSKPTWGKNCINCMACICLCPTNAIEYGNKGKKRYECPKDYH